MTNNETDFSVLIENNKTDSGTLDMGPILEAAAMGKFVNNTSTISSVILNDEKFPDEVLNYREIIDLGMSPQTSLPKTMRISSHNLFLANTNDLVGKFIDTIRTNINTEVRLTYEHRGEGRNKKKKFAEIQQLIHDFNDEINIKKIIRESVITAYLTGNWIGYLRRDDDQYVIDEYPLGVVEISPYNIAGNPVVMFNIRQLKNRLRKVYRKTKKNKALFFENMEEEVEANYSSEVVEAFKSNEAYVPLEYSNTGVIRINNMGRPYGCSPLLRAYQGLRVIGNLENSDDINSKARARKVIAQIMRKELIADDPRRDTYPQQAYAHATLASAFSNHTTVLVTCPPTVESLAYIEPSAELISIETHNYYRSKVLSTLGVSYLSDSDNQSVTTGSISVSQLMKEINSITEQLDNILYRWYRQVLIDNGYDPYYAPHVSVIDSELMSMDMRKSMSDFYYNTLGASRDTIFEMAGLNVKDEAEKRKAEKEEGYDELFVPYGNSYTKSSDDTEETDSGRPESTDNEAKQVYDQETNSVNG